MAQRRRRRARCMLHCPQRHVAMRMCAVRCVPATAAREPREATGVFYRGTGNVTGTGGHTDRRAHDGRPLPRLYTQTGRDALAKSNGQHAHVKSDKTHPPTSSSKFVGTFILPSKFSVSPSTAHSAILPSDQLTAPGQTLPSLPQPFSDCSLHRHARNCHSTCTYRAKG